MKYPDLRGRAALWCSITLLAATLAVPVAPAHAQNDAGTNGAPGAMPNDAGAGAQATDTGDTPAAEGATPVVTPKLVQVDDAALAMLPKNLGRGTGAISLRASLAALDANVAARDALVAWVRAGGVVFLHTDSAQLFGYVTVTARQGSNRFGGELFGRAKAALPFGAQPLLCDLTNRVTGSATPTVRAGADITRLPGVNVVYYEMQAGDQLVRSHPTATPLLQVTDLASNGTTPTYAAAIAGFGRGWAIFTPDYIDQRRGDGALFVRNLLTLMPDARGRKLWTGVSAAAIETATTAGGSPAVLLSDLAGVPVSPALPALGTPAAAAPPVAAPIAPESTRVLLQGADAAAIAGVLRGTDPAPVTAVLQLLRARLEWQRGDATKAATWIEAAAKAYPEAAEVALLRGEVTASAAQDATLASPARAQILAKAITYWDAGATAPALARGVMAPATVGTNLAAPAPTPVLTVSGVPVSALRDWSAWAQRAAAMFNAEPPLVQQIGNGPAAITLHYYEDDTSIRVMAPALLALADANNFGWRVDNEEVLLFPTPEYYAAYRRASGLLAQFAPLPAGGLGDVSGARILMVAVPSFPRVIRNAKGQVRFLPGEASGANILARLHSYALMNALAEGGRRPPAWTQLGLEALSAAVISGTDEIAPATATLAQFAQGNALLTPEQFAAARTGGAAAPDLAEAQGVAMMAYFYRTFGAGSVAETFQRLGAGQDIDTALQATTQLGEAEFFTSWRDADFGN